MGAGPGIEFIDACSDIEFMRAGPETEFVGPGLDSEFIFTGLTTEFEDAGPDTEYVGAPQLGHFPASWSYFVPQRIQNTGIGSLFTDCWILLANNSEKRPIIKIMPDTIGKYHPIDPYALCLS